MEAVRSTWDRLTAGPDHLVEPADLRTIDIAGLGLPRRAGLAVALVTFALLFDYSRTFIPSWASAGGPGREALAIAAERFVLFGLVPLLVVIAGFRDRPSRYGLTLGDWRTGSLLVGVGCLLMTPAVLWLATLPEVQAYYAPSGRIAPLTLIAANGADLAATEFAFRGFLMLTLVRVVGPFGVLLATMPFVFSHLGKPELELFSTLGGGLVYGWLAWRTRSVLWGALGHTYILTLVALAAAAAHPAA